MMFQTLGGRCIHRSASGIRVMDNGIYRWMMFESDAIQSLLYKASPQRRGLKYITALTFMARAQPGAVCMLGLGGAGAAHALSPYLQGHPIMAVELSADVIETAQQYFMTDRINNLSILQSEAAQYIAGSNEHFQHILVDLYDAHQFPDSCNQPEFFAQCQARLTDNGVLAVNLANRRDHRRVFDLMTTQFQGRTVVFPVSGRENLVIAACNAPTLQNYLDLFTDSRQVKSLHWDPDWACIAELRF
ncbi:spermidine synthase [Legionella sp. CNM-4043-24]|uniref:spermidine synthase n=1 Tax=Legionella sp. CNM-4043-24 TaxID=3421646 RepID=UPI00403AE244